MIDRIDWKLLKMLSRFCKGLHPIRSRSSKRSVITSYPYLTFKWLYLKISPNKIKINCMQAFQLIDQDKDGFISKNDIRATFDSLGIWLITFYNSGKGILKALYTMRHLINFEGIWYIGKVQVFNHFSSTKWIAIRVIPRKEWFREFTGFLY